MKYTQTIEIPRAEAKEHQDFLDKSIKQYQETDECDRTEDTIASYSARFDEQGIGVDIKVCGGQPPFIDAVVFEINEIPSDEVTGLGPNERWNEMYALEPISDDLLGEYLFEVDNNKYTVLVKGV